jgi:uncharacterized protein
MNADKSLRIFHNQYLYCPNTNTLINKEIEDIYFKYAAQSRNVSLEAIPVDRETIQRNIKRLKQIIIETCQDCSLNCLYCIFGSNKYFYTRKQSSLKISYDIAKNAIDYIYNFICNRKKKELSIGFYGGEPLLNFQVIKKIVEYSKKKFKNWSLIFTVTTNCTVLNDDIIYFLIKNNFKTLISLDGPAENHDAKRVFPDGSGSFDIVIKNIKKIRSINPHYYQDMVTFSIVYSKDLSLKKLYHFFKSNELVKKNFSNFGYVTDSDTTYYEHYSYNPHRLKRDRKYVFNKILKQIREKQELSPIETNFIIEHSILKKALNARSFNVLSSTCYYEERLFVSADGKFHFCEKINDKFPIGSVENGFDYPRMIEIVNEYISVIKKYCAKCELRFICMRCYANLARNGYFEIDKEFCDNAKYSIKKMFEELIQINEAKAVK